MQNVFKQMLQRAEDLENLRKASLATPKKTQHEQVVDQYVAYVKTQMYQIPQEHWFSFTVENVGLIQSYINKKLVRYSGFEMPPATTSPSVQVPNYHAHHMSQISQNLCLRQQQQPANTFQQILTGLGSSGCCPQQQSPLLAQSCVTPSSSNFSIANGSTSTSPTSYLNLQNASLPMPTQPGITTAPGNLSLQAQNLTEVVKDSSSTDGTDTDASSTDVIQFSESLY